MDTDFFKADFENMTISELQSELITYRLGTDYRKFCVRHIARNPVDQWAMNEKCQKLVDIGFLESAGNSWGWYRKRMVESEKMDLLSEEADAGPVDIWLPFNLSDMVEVYPGNIIIFAGAKDSGKTGLSLNTAQQNRHAWDVHYFNSEMGAAELKKRLSVSDITIDMWQEGCTFHRRASNFQDAVKPKPNSLNIIDFLEIHDEFYAAGAMLKAIHDRLDGAICIVNIQKRHPGLDVPPLGGWRSLEVCRVCLSVDYGAVKIKIAKNWRDPERNPKNLVASFKLRSGYIVSDFRGWHAEGDE